ncbi:helix-turn-helix domain-containing protein [Pseudomonas solani]|uniref:helix-turn-helix domain-containing protein n=1 Tax=Pseudomonas solani TaxID=2731552 RepID=UPI0035BE5968
MTAKELLNALISKGFLQREIAKEVGVSQPTIHRALRGSSVSYETGKALERLLESLEQDPGNPESNDTAPTGDGSVL